MSMYRTVTVNPILIGGTIEVSPTIEGQVITVNPTLSEGSITVATVLSDSVVSISPVLNGNTIEVSPEYFTSVRTYGGEVEFYQGPYEYTPTQGTHTVQINGLLATQNITINPIPSNYGLITWSGSVLTVS